MFIVFRSGPNPTSGYAILTDGKEIRVTTNCTLDNGVLTNTAYSYHEPEKASYFIVKTEDAANQIAANNAFKTPGVEWHVAELRTKFVSHPSPVVITEYTEKGALPK